MRPSKLAAALVAAAVAFFYAIPIWIILRAEAEDRFSSYLLATAFALLALWISMRAIESFSTSLSGTGLAQLRCSLTSPFGITKRYVKWADVSSATTDGRYIWLVSADGSAKVDPEMFWNALSVHEYIGRRLRPFNVSIVRIARR